MPIQEIEILKKLDFTKQLTFAYITCERLFPNYVYFSENYHYGNPTVLRESINYLHDNLFKSESNESKIRSLVKKVEKNTPDTENFDTIFVSSALDACTCILDSLEFLIDKDFAKIQNISTYATDTVDMYIQEIENLNFNTDQDFQKKIDQHPLMHKELAIQSGVINFLNKIKSIDQEDIQTLIDLQKSNMKSSLDS